MKNTIKYLRKREYKMGNGQCPDCCGQKPNIGWWTNHIGHELNCPLAKSLTVLGEMAVYKKLNPERVLSWELNKYGILIGVCAK